MAERLVTERLASGNPRLDEAIREHGHAINRTLMGSDILYLVDGVTAPVAIPGVAQIYIDIADGDLKCRFGDNVTKTLATDT